MLTNEVNVLIISTMTRKIILDDSGAISQGASQTDYPSDGLRLLARIIAYHLMASELGHKNSKKSGQAAGGQEPTDNTQSNINNEIREPSQDA